MSQFANRGLAIVPYRGGAIISTWFDCCDGSLVWWDDQPAPLDKEQLQFPRVPPEDTAFFDPPTALWLDDHQLAVGVTALRWIEEPVWHVSAGLGILELE